MTLGDQQGDGIGELNLPAVTAGHPPQRVEDGTVQQVAAGRRVKRGRLVDIGLFHHALDLEHVGISRVRHGFDVEDAVGADLFRLDLDGAQHGATPFGAHLGHGDQHTGGQHQVVRQKHGHGVLVGRKNRLDAAHRMAQAQRFRLDHRLDLDQRGGATNLGQHGLLAARLEGALENQVLDEVRDDAVLALGGDDHQPFRAGLGSLLRHQFDARRVDYGQQLLGHRLGGRKKARSQACRRHDRRARNRDPFAQHGLNPNARVRWHHKGPAVRV